MKRIMELNQLSGKKPKPATIDKFRNEFYFLSNYYTKDVVINYQGKDYKSVEHAYQAAKTDDEDVRIAIKTLSSPGAAKKMGRTIKLRDSWETEKLGVMEELVRYKFNNHEILKARLLATGDSPLVEGNTWNDCYWGVCRGKGENHLGKILMKVREELRQSKNQE